MTFVQLPGMRFDSNGDSNSSTSGQGPSSDDGYKSMNGLLPPTWKQNLFTTEQNPQPLEPPVLSPPYHDDTIRVIRPVQQTQYQQHQDHQPQPQYHIQQQHPLQPPQVQPNNRMVPYDFYYGQPKDESSSNSRRPQRKRRRPPHSYASMIAQAILTSAEHKLTLRDIYDYVQKRYPHMYEANEPGWQNTIRHNLSLNRCFCKLPRTNGTKSKGKGGYWCVDIDELNNTTFGSQILTSGVLGSYEYWRQRLYHQQLQVHAVTARGTAIPPPPPVDGTPSSTVTTTTDDSFPSEESLASTTFHAPSSDLGIAFAPHHTRKLWPNF